MLLMRLAAETTVDAYLLMEDDTVVALIRDGAEYEELLEYVTENY
jgi:hypothetical protein